MTLETNSFADASATALQDFEPGLFGPIPIRPDTNKTASGVKAKASRGSRPTLTWRDFVLPELIGQSDNGEVFVKAVSSAEQEQQTLHLLDTAQNIAAFGDEARERKLYCQYAKTETPDVPANLRRFLPPMLTQRPISRCGWRES